MKHSANNERGPYICFVNLYEIFGLMSDFNTQLPTLFRSEVLWYTQTLYVPLLFISYEQHYNIVLCKCNYRWDFDLWLGLLTTYTLTICDDTLQITDTQRLVSSFY